MLALICPSCQKKFSVKEELAGKKVKCPGCGGFVAVGQTAAATLAMTGSGKVDEERTLPPRAPVKEDAHTLPRKPGAKPPAIAWRIQTSKQGTAVAAPHLWLPQS